VSLELKIGSLESEKIIDGSLESEKIGSLQVHTGYLTFSLKKRYHRQITIAWPSLSTAKFIYQWLNLEQQLDNHPVPSMSGQHIYKM